MLNPQKRCLGPAVAVAIVNTLALLIAVVLRPLTSTTKQLVTVLSAACTVITSWLLVAGVHRQDRAIIDISVQVATFAVYWGYVAFGMTLAGYGIDLSSKRAKFFKQFWKDDLVDDTGPSSSGGAFGQQLNADDIALVCETPPCMDDNDDQEPLLAVDDSIDEPAARSGRHRSATIVDEDDPNRCLAVFKPRSVARAVEHQRLYDELHTMLNTNGDDAAQDLPEEADKADHRSMPSTPQVSQQRHSADTRRRQLRAEVEL